MPRRAAIARAAALLAVAAVVVAITAARPRRAHAEDVPSSQASLVLGSAIGVGSFGERFRWSWLGGIEAAISHRFTKNALWDLGLVWTFSYGRHYPSDASDPIDPLTAVQLESLGRARVRLPVSFAALLLHADGGIELLRTSAPLAPGDTDSYVGGVIGGGVQIVLGRFVFGAGVRYGVLGDAPGSFRFLATIGVGRR